MKLNKQTLMIVAAFFMLAVNTPLEAAGGDVPSGEVAREAESGYDAFIRSGRDYWEEGKRRAAIKMFRKAVKLDPEHPLAHFYLGKAYFFEKKPKKGIVEFGIFEEKMDMLSVMDEETLDLYSSFLHDICYIYSTQKLYNEALAVCRKITKLMPDDQKAHYNTAVCYYVSYRNRSRAYSELRRVIEIDPNTRIADMARYYIDYMRRNPDSRIIGDFGFLREN